MHLDLSTSTHTKGYEEYEGYTVHELAKKYGKKDLDEILAATPNQTHSFGIDKVFINGTLVCDENVVDAEACKTSGYALTV